MTSARVTKRRGVSPIGPGLLDRIGFTDHAIDRFSTRAGLTTSDRRIVEPIIRDLLRQEGLVVAERPRWARSRNTADLYLQLGEWMLFIGTRRRLQSAGYAIVTVVNGPEGATWREARRRGYIFTRPPPLITDRERRRPRLLISALVALMTRRRARASEVARYRLW